MISLGSSALRIFVALEPCDMRNMNDRTRESEGGGGNYGFVKE